CGSAALRFSVEPHSPLDALLRRAVQRSALRAAFASLAPLRGRLSAQPNPARPLPPAPPQHRSLAAHRSPSRSDAGLVGREVASPLAGAATFLSKHRDRAVEAL